MRIRNWIIGLGVLLSLGACEEQGTAPEAILPIPTEAQLAWHKLETYAFIHFGLNTYNDLEWGYGDTPAKTFAPDTLAVSQWVQTLKAAGMKGIILTAKHHDGFCLWPTKTTDYSVKNSPWKNGKGDLVKELSQECKKEGLLFGLYLSPWDRHNANYGKAEYVDSVFHQQIKELTTNYGQLFEYWFDGANGGSGWYGGADEHRSIDPNSYYKYEEAVKLLKENNPNVMVFGGTVPTIRWVGNERGWAGETNFSAYDFSKEKHYSEAQWGMPYAEQWIPAEVDVSIRPGWFYHHREDHQVRSLQNLVNLYYQSVGRNANLLLNCPIALDGRIPKEDSIRLIQWRKYLDNSFKKDLLQKASIKSSDSRKGTLFASEHLTDGNDETYWASKDECISPSLVVELDEAEDINVLSLSEYIPLGQRVLNFALYYDKEGEWTKVPTQDSLTTIGYKRLIRFPRIHTQSLKLDITEASAEVCLSKISAFNTPDIVEAPKAYRSAEDKLHIFSPNRDVKLSYKLSGKSWTNYTQPVEIFSDQGEVEVRATLGKAEETKKLNLPYSAKHFTIIGLSKGERNKLLDCNPYNFVTLPKEIRSLKLKADEKLLVQEIVYTPNQSRDAQGHIQNYELYLDSKLVSKGEFSNIRNNPIPRTISLDKPISCRNIELKAISLANRAKNMSLADLAIY